MHPTLRPLIHPQPEKFRRLPIDRHRYTLARVCRAWGFARSLIYRRHGDDAKAHRPTPGAPRYCEDAQVAATLRKIIAESPFPAERHRKLWARLRRAGVVVSRERVRRILRDFAILPQPGMGIITPRPEILWGIDAARYRTSFDGQVFILFVIEHCTGECLAIDVVAESEQGTASFPSAAPHARSAANLRRVEVPQSGWVGSVLGKDTVPWAAIQPPDFRAPLRTFGLPDSRSI